MEEIALEICNALDQVKGAAESIESEITKQGAALRETRQRAEKNKANLEQ